MTRANPIPVGIVPLFGAALVLGAAIGACDDSGGVAPGGGFTGGPPSGGANTGWTGGPGAPIGGTGTGVPAPAPAPRAGTGGTGGTTSRGTAGSTGSGGAGGRVVTGGTGGTPPAQPPPGGMIVGKACKNLDLVFSIDNSSSMTEEQMVMGTTIFPAFARKLRMINPPLESFRVGVLDACPMPANFHTRGRGGPCNFAGGRPWIESTSPRLDAEFACVGAIDSMGKTCTGMNDDEQPASTAAASLEAPASTGANNGFLRRDSVLVILAMTDEDEQPTPQRSNRQVYDRLVALKGDPRLVVFLGIGGSRNCNGPYGSANNAQNLQAITQLFTAQGRGVFWDLCAGSLEEGLERAIATIARACMEAPPPPPMPPPMPPPPGRDAGPDLIIE